MPPKKQPSLRDFLKKEVAKAKSKVKHPDTPNSGRRYPLTQSNLSSFGSSPGSAKLNSAAGSPTTRRHGFGSPSSPHEQSTIGSPTRRYSDVNSLFGDGDQDADSIFGDPCDSIPIRDQEMQAQLEQLLAESTPKTPIPTFTESTNLRDLKEELKKLVIRETGGKMMSREWDLLQRQKGPLIEEVRWVEESERKAFDETRTKNNQEHELPEPVGHFEKKQLEWGMKRLEKAKAGADRISKRPRQEGDGDKDNDLDGEERLRLGKTLKPKPLQMTGHFWSTRRDYFPGLPGAEIATTKSGAEVLLEKTLRDFDPEGRRLKRRKLAELGEALAMTDRRIKR